MLLYARPVGRVGTGTEIPATSFMEKEISWNS